MELKKNYGHWVNQLSHQLKRQMDARLAEMGVTGVQGKMLHYIIERQKTRPVFQKDLEEVFGLRRSTATGILQLLEKNGLLRREAVAHDARLKSLIPTEKADTICKEMHIGILETEKLLIKNIAPDKLQIFLEVAQQMSENLGS